MEVGHSADVVGSHNMSCSPNSLKGDYIRNHLGDYYRGY